MASATYSIKVDFGRDGTYAHASSDITAYVSELTWNNGMTQPDMEFAPPARLTVTLDNSSGAFNLEDSGATFYGLFAKGLLVRVVANDGSDHTLFIGKLRNIPSQDIRTLGSASLTLDVSDLMEDLLDVEFSPSLMTDVTVDVPMTEVFSTGVIALPYASSFWILDESTLGTDTVLLGEADMISFETGVTSLAYSGDVQSEGKTLRAQQFLRDMVTADCGARFWFDVRTGKFTFHNRHHDVNPSIAATYDQTQWENCDYVPQSEVINQATVQYTPREIGAASSVVYSSPNPIQLAGSETKTITARYRDPTYENTQIGVMGGIPPLRGTDYVANANSAGTGRDFTDKITISVEFGGSNATLTIVNARHYPVYMTTLQLRGTPIRSFRRDQVSSMNSSSLKSYDLHPVTKSIPSVDDEEVAQQYADSIVSRYRTPFAQMRSISLNANGSSTLLSAALTRTIGNAITVTRAATSHDSDYVIVGERHAVRMGGEHTHNTTWILKPLAREQYWVLGQTGFSELGTTTRLAF